MTANCSLLFVYGTLLRRSAHPMAAFLALRGTFLGEAKIRGRLYNLGRFPGLVTNGQKDWVYGDLFDLGEHFDSILAELDRYEDAESTADALFERRLADVIGADGEAVQAWVYWFRGEVREEARIAAGRYL